MNKLKKGWKSDILGNVAELQRGFDLPSAKRINGNIPIISSGGISGYHNEPKVSAPGVITGRYGTIGSVFYVEEDFWPLNTSLWVKNFFGNNPKFVYYLLSNIDFKKFSDKTGVPGVNRNELHSIKVNIPPLNEQIQIAETLSTWDNAIQTTEKLIENSQQQKKALRQILLNGKNSLNWKEKSLEELVVYQQPTKFLVKDTTYNDNFKTPVLTAGKSFILGYTNENDGIYNNLPVIIFDDFTTDSQFVTFPFKIKSSAIKLLTAKKNVCIKYIFEAMQMIDFEVGGHQRHWISIFSKLKIRVPLFEEQQKIAEILSTADQEIDTLQHKLECLKLEKEALMQRLL